MKRKLGIIAVAALSTMAFSQLALAESNDYTWLYNAQSTPKGNQPIPFYLLPKAAPTQSDRSQVTTPGINTDDAFWYRSTGGVPL